MSLYLKEHTENISPAILKAKVSTIKLEDLISSRLRTHRKEKLTRTYTTIVMKTPRIIALGIVFL